MPEMEGPVKATDQFNGQDKHVGESELSMEGMRFRSGWILRNRSEGCREWDRRRDVETGWVGRCGMGQEVG